MNGHAPMALLLQGGGHKNKPVLPKGYSSYQIFKAMLLYFSVRDMVRVPTCIGYEGMTVPENQGPVLFDCARGLNILFKMSPCSYILLRHEANRTLDLLSDPFNDHFEACFITRVDNPMQRFDFLARFPLDGASRKDLRCLDAYDDITQYCMKSHQLISQGLGDRALLVNVQTDSPRPWPITSVRSPASQTPTLLVGLLLNPSHTLRTVDRGPSAGEKAAASKFRDFWGEKAELRRFKDGSIVESLIWTPSIDEGVLVQILKHVLRRHLGDEASKGLSVLGGSFEHVLPINQTADPLAIYQPVMNAYELLDKQIRTLGAMPLQVLHIAAGDSQLRYTALDTPWLDSASCQMTVSHSRSIS